MTKSEPGEELDLLARKAIGAAIEVHKHLGPGYLESVYESALAVEFDLRGIQYQRQPPVDLLYKGASIGTSRLDYLVTAPGAGVVVEIKAVEQLAPIHTAQMISYLKATRLPLGLLINFNVQLLKTGIERIVLTE